MEKQIDLWLKKGVITADQAAIMLKDVGQSKKLVAQNRFVIAVSIIGAALLGIGAILFISANWSYMTPMIKVLILSSSTLLAYLLGYYFRYERGNLPNVGSSLLFLSALLVGASVFLVTQIYHFNANTHGVILIWLLLLLPFVYTVRNYAVATLFTGAFYVWMFMFLDQAFPRGSEYNYAFMLALVSVYFLSTLILFSFGALHKLVPVINNVGKAMKWISLQVALIIAFYLSFDFSGDMYYYRNNYFGSIPESVLNLLLAFISASLVLAFLNWYTVREQRIRSVEFYATIAATLLITGYAFYPLQSTLFAILFNLLIFGFSIGLIYTGYQQEEIKIVNLGAFWICALIIVRYIDFFWEMFDTSIFFLIGGTILIVGAVFLERARRNLKLKFNNNNITND